MFMTVNIKRLFVRTFTKVYNYRITNRVKYLTIINNFANRYVWGLTNDRFADIQEQSDLPTLSCLVWWLILFTIRTFWLFTLQELIDLLKFNGLFCWLTILALFLLTIIKQRGLLIVNGLTSVLTLLIFVAFVNGYFYQLIVK